VKGFAHEVEGVEGKMKDVAVRRTELQLRNRGGQSYCIRQSS
jgi:hypothetical protein